MLRITKALIPEAIWILIQTESCWQETDVNMLQLHAIFLNAFRPEEMNPTVPDNKVAACSCKNAEFWNMTHAYHDFS